MNDLRIALHRADTDEQIDMRRFQGEGRDIIADVISWLQIEVFPYWGRGALVMRWTTDDPFVDGGMAALALLCNWIKEDGSV